MADAEPDEAEVGVHGGPDEGCVRARCRPHTGSRRSPPGLVQVWSLTQFYSIDFSLSRIGVKCAFSRNAQSRFPSAVVDGVLGPPRLARHT